MNHNCVVRDFTRVVPLVGTWIEIAISLSAPPIAAVVPLVGTWIEI